VVVNGIDTRNSTVTELSRHVGLVFQNPDHMFFRDTVREEVAFGPENLGIVDLDAVIDRVVREVRLDSVQHLYPRWLSRGERQRLAIACILAMQPPVIALDEPTTGLDGREAREIMAIVRDLQIAGHTIVMITHSRDIAQACADRVVTIANGTIASDCSAGMED
jgi:energy-coupling factor transport system ATP-binding protein